MYIIFVERPYLEAVFTITLGCSAIKRRLEPVPMSGRSDMEDSLGQQDFTPDWDRDRGLRAAPRAWTRPPARRDGPGAADLAALPTRRHTLAQPDRDTGPGQRLDPAAVADTLGRDGRAGPGARPAGRHAAGPSGSDPGQLLGTRQTRRGSDRTQP